jgi:hypothetical protein
MNNEPVAWISQDVLDADHIIKAVVRREQDEQHTIPLYTHPAKELTDEEILSLTGFKNNPYDIFIEYEKEDLIEFARAILRKAQEK